MKTASRLLCLLFLIPLFTVAQKAITPEIISDLQGPREVALSPDGQTIAYTLRIPGAEGDSPGTSWYEIHTCDLEGNSHRKYIGKPYSGYSLQWSPDGQRLYFLSRRKEHDSHTQLYAIPLNGGEAELVTEHENSVRSYKVSPDGKQVAFTSRDGLSKDEKLAASKGQDWIVYGQDYKYTRLYVQNLATSNSRLVFSQDLEVTDFTWTPNNMNLVFQASEIPETDHIYMYKRIYQVNASGGNPSLVARTEGKLGPMAVSPDGRYLAYAGAVDISDPLAQSLFVVPMQGGDPVNYSEGMQASLLGMHWKDGGEILLQFAEGVYSSLYLLDLDKRKREPVYNKGIIIRSLDYHAKSGALAVVGHSPQYPSEVHSATVKKPEFKRLTFSNPELDGVRLAKQEVVEWNSSDGIAIQGVLTYPLDYVEGRAYPLLLQIHGGPEGISYNGFNTRAVYPIQFYAASGFFVLEPNYRGSQGRGVEFAKADHKDLAGKEFEDVLAGVDMLIDRGLADKDKVGTGGFSYGGYFSAWAATKHSQRFKAAMVGAGITNWISFTGTTDIIYENSLVHWNLWWFEHMDLVWDRSPLAHLNNAQTPTLVVHGEKDLRVPIGQGQEIYNGLKLRNIPTEMVVYKRQPHGIRERAAQIDYMNRTRNWFEKYVK